MKKNRIRLTESQLHRVIKESVKRVLKEGQDWLLNIEIYQNGALHCAYISDNRGGSGIEVKETNYERFAEEVGAYIADYAFSEDTDEEDTDEYE